MIRVFFDHQIFSIATYGGVARYYCELVNHLNQSKDFRAEIYAGVHMNKFLHEFAFDCLKGIYLPRIPKLDKKSLRFRFNDYLTEKLYLKKTKPDILHKTLFDSQYQTPKDVINVISVYDMIHEKYQKITGKDPSRIEKQAVEQKRKAIQAADHVICISEQTKKDLLDLIEIHDSKVSVIYLGSDIKPAADGQNTIKDPFILYVGQRQGYKNFRTLLQAYCVNERLNKQFKLVCFGAGTIKNDEKQILKKYKIDQNQLIHKTGKDDVLAALYQNASVLVYPSLYEGFGIPLVEAMRLGCPVASSNTSCLPEIAQKAALYFDPLNIESINETVEKILYNKTEKNILVQKGFARAKEFTWEKTALKTKEIYSNLVRKTLI